jgi:prolyl-tRNA synthetase
MRGREFVMKDMYSCSIDAEQHEKFYNATIDAYKRIYDRIGIGQDTYVTFASGGAFTQFSHEFQTVCEAGEDSVYLHRGKNIAINEEVLNDETLEKLGVSKDELEKVSTAEVGNIFNFGIQKSEDTDFTFTNDQGEKQYVHLGSYGIGITRVMGVVVEKFSDDKGIVWPESIAPFAVHLVALGENIPAEAEQVYADFTAKGIEVLFDDRTGVMPGEKFADADLIGIPHRIVISERSIKNGGAEYKSRTSVDSEIIAIADIAAKFHA